MNKKRRPIKTVDWLRIGGTGGVDCEV